MKVSTKFVSFVVAFLAFICVSFATTSVKADTYSTNKEVVVNTLLDNGYTYIELPVIKITGITSRDYITYTILIVHAPNLVIMTGNTTIILKIIFTNYRTCFDSLKVLRIISCY